MRNWPFFDLSVTTPRLELRLPSLDDLDELADRAAEGIHDAGSMPFAFPWSDTGPAERGRSTLQFHFRTWGELSPAAWNLAFVAVFEGEVVGTQGVQATDFPVTREVLTGSWLGRRFQGRGIGTEMRRAALQFAFAGLGATDAVTSAFEDNHASLSVTAKLGYRDDGTAVHNRQGTRTMLRRFRLTSDDWADQPDVEIHNLAPCLPILGL
ncbi:GNAT family N-acetyltransferase [Nonomuraea sp. NN258]|uniref:GNAT family N-acetyltransferase n=1 Tax=Nonomuraea antri TaxID=2730852 RepID=UPI001569C261|nr:GNAT family protein [Nonomuraea antri]NRQ36181.1 GNAT family N-acetyltransferase [Nonomuraea antri]